eukprot:1142665-Pelagomonas_calceolata.AAC.7
MSHVCTQASPWAVQHEHTRARTPDPGLHNMNTRVHANQNLGCAFFAHTPGKLVAPRAPEKEPHPLTNNTNGLPPPFRGTSAAGLTSMASDQGARLAEQDALQPAAVGRAVPQWAANEAKFGAFSLWPAAGCLPGRGLQLPRTQVHWRFLSRLGKERKEKKNYAGSGSTPHIN